MSSKHQEFRKQLLKYWNLTEEEDRQARTPSLKTLTKKNPPNTEKFVQRMLKASSKKENILIFGDNDLDGCMSAAILLDSIQNIGCNARIIFAKHHHNDGPGIRMKHIKGRLKNIDIIITIDCSVRDKEVVDELAKKNVDLWTIDHHPYQFGIKEQCVNCTFEGEHFKYYCAAGLAFRISLEFQKIKQDETKIKNHLIGCMLATIADHVQLRKDNRAIVICGIKEWFKTDLPVFKLLHSEDKKDIGKNFNKIRKKAVSPLNSCPRYDDPQTTVESIFCKNEIKALDIVRKIKKYNSKRINEAKKMNSLMEGQKLKKDCINVFYQEGFSAMYVSQVASKISFQEHLPSIVFAKSNDGCLRGSARSPDGCEIRDLVISALGKIAIDIGGHPQAFGLTIKESNYEKAKNIIENLKIKFNKEIYQSIALNDLSTEEALEIIKEYEPFGSAFKRPKIHG
ncbi:hypothetical protein CL645_05845 [bacterium]|nr:hypothetical protein [bacterium]